MSIQSKINKHIEEEKQLSEYKISLLKAGETKQYKERLILKEEDFLNFDFSKITFNSLEEIRDAIMLFKVSREEFDMKYGDSKKKSLEKITQIDLDILNGKILFFEEKCRWILDTKVKEINIIDNSSIRSLLKVVPDNIKALNSSQLKKIEGSIIGKHRGRIQILLYCIARHFFVEIKKIKKEIADLKQMSYLDLKKINQKLFLILEEYNKHIYQYFNFAKIELPPLLSHSNGENTYLQSVHSLKNIVNDIEKFAINKISDKSTIVYEDDGSPVAKKSAERAYGINTGIKRVGSESINILHIEMYSESGANVTRLFEREFFNNYVKGNYIKSISTIPMWNLLKDVEADNFLKPDFVNFWLDESDKIDFSKINKGLSLSVPLSKENSIILVAETRSDAEHLEEVEKVISLLINSFKKEYQERFNYYLPDNLEDVSRKGNLKKFLEPKNANGQNNCKPKSNSGKDFRF
jgi:hypothetical protein